MAAPHLYAGASGYSYAPWKGPFYPADLKNAAMLGYYAERLPAVEINNTFYRLPKTKVLEDWAAQTPDDFRFALKASRRITHIHRLKEVGELTGYLFETVGALGGKLGPILFQLPPHMKQNLDRLRDLLVSVPAGRRVALEFRNQTWFEEPVFDLLREHGAALVTAETDDDDTAPEIVATADWGYLRLRRADYGEAELTAWAERIGAQAWADAYVFFKHEDEGAAPRLALRLMALAEA